MREVFFNSFKEKILKGQVPASFECSGVPVNSNFFDNYDNTDIALEQYRNLEDFETYSKNVSGTDSLDSCLFKYKSFGVEYSAYEPDDLSDKPIFVNPDNWDKFLHVYSTDVSATSGVLATYLWNSDSGDIQTTEDIENTNSGFYYVTKKSHLNWIANRTNDENNFNNKIKIVLGDDIGNLNDRDTLESMICTSPERPFQGVFDMNGHKLINKRFVCKSNSNGLIGYLGPRGVVRNGIVQDILFANQQKISLDKIVQDCSDVVVGALVGTNYGTVENIITSGEMRFDGFCPEVYTVGNKYEYTQGDSTNANSAYNGFFPNKFCVNSIYNVIPYVGYFNEGADSFYDDIANSIYTDCTDSLETRDGLVNVIVNSCNVSLGYADVANLPQSFRPGLSMYHEPKCSVNDGFDQASVKMTKIMPSTKNGFWGSDYYRQFYGDVGYCPSGSYKNGFYSPMVTTEYTQLFLDSVLCNTIDNLGSWKTYDEEDDYPISKLLGSDDNTMFDKDFDHGSYIAQQIMDTVVLFMKRGNEKITPHQRMNPGARIAYFCSPIVGNNFGKIQKIDCRHWIKESSDTFVGFIGGVCGKQNCGTINGVTTLFDIRENDMTSSADSGCQNMYRSYTNEYEFKPEYGDDYHNLVNVFGYNYDYYQNANGLATEELEAYSANSGNCVKVSQRFYEFDSFVCSGVNGNCYLDDDKNPFGSPWTFNSYDNRDVELFSNCNFSVNSSATSATIGSGIPEAVRDAKLTFGPPSADLSNAQLSDAQKSEIRDSLLSMGATNLFRMTYSPAVFQKEDEVFPNQGEIKLFNTWNDKWKSNVSVPLWSASADIDEELSTIEFTVRHLDIDYLGDAAKGFDDRDEPDGLNTCTKADGSSYELTLEDVMTYAKAFSNTDSANGGIGFTRTNAANFAKNIMSAKVAIGCDMLSNSAFDPSKIYPGYEKPFDPMNGPFGTTNSNTGSQDDDWVPTDYDKLFVIPSGTGPNDTTTDWKIFSDSDNGPDFCWYMPPGTYVGGSNGPEAKATKTQFDFRTSASIDTVNENARNPNFFCSIREDMKWDLVGNDNNSRDKQRDFGVQRSLITVTPMQTDALKAKAKTILAKIIGNTDALEKLVTPEEAEQISGDKLAWLYGAEWSARINTIRIPLAGRTQNGASKIGYFGNTSVSGLSGIYYTEQNSDPSVLVRKREDGKGEIVSLDAEEERKIGNLDDMYIDMSILAPADEDGAMREMQVILRIPIQKITIPISAVRELSTEENLQVGKYTFDFANEFVGNDKMKYNLRHVNFYPLIPAYDKEDQNGTQIGFQLKSIYNIGAVAGMINHSENFIEYGNYEDLTNTQAELVRGSVNRATCGTITDVHAVMTKNAADFINRLTKVTEVDGEIDDANDRVIGVASKFAMIAPVYEYHQNEMGTSCFSGETKEEANTNGLMVLAQVDQSQNSAQLTNIENVIIDGEVGVDLTKINDRLFKPVIEWANVSNVLDYNNFFMKRSGITTSHTQYVPFQSSNYPECINIMHNVCSMAGDYWFDLKALGLGRSWDRRDAWPIRSREIVAGSDTYGNSDQCISTDEYFRFGSVYFDNTIRNTMSKTYHLFPEWLFNVSNLRILNDGEEIQGTDLEIHMSPTCDSPNSDYYDVFQQMLDGSPNFAFTKLYKSMMTAPVTLNKYSPGVTFDPPSIPEMYNSWIFEVNRVRDLTEVRDRYFTWDYDMREKSNHELSFHVQYAKKSGIRGLWIHQVDRESDGVPFLKYAMKGANECMNDGGCVRLGYMPSEWALIQLMNRPDDNSKPGNWFDEGIAVSGDDYRGMLLVDKKSNDLVCMLDAGYGRDIDSGCYIWEFDKRTDFGPENATSAYGLLAQIDGGEE